MKDRFAGASRRPTAVAGVSAVLLAVAMLVGWLWPGTAPYRLLLLAGAVLAGTGIARRAVVDLRHRIVGIELLVTVAVIGAILIGELWEAAAVTFLFVLGDALESLTLARTRRALGDLLDLTPTVALVVRKGEQIEVNPAEVTPGELVLVKPGARSPVDGEVTVGMASVDEASITGESMPVEKAPGDAVFAGTVVVDGSLVVEARGVGADTLLARIVHRVEDAQEAKAPAQRFMDRFARWYTPAVVALAAVAFVVSNDVELALTLLVIGCPGALVISIPVSVVAGIGRSARHGILIKGGTHLEAAGRITTVAFDKTGTLTRGRPRLAEVVSLHPAVDAVALAARAESGSEHSLARPILEAARRRGVALPTVAADFVAHVGGGVEATVDGARVAVGSPRLMTRLGVPIGQAATEASERLTASGQTAVLVARDDEIVGVLGLSDEVRADAAFAVDRLNASGIDRIVMLTGDDPRVAQAVADEVGITEVGAGLLPEDKLEAIRTLQADGEVVAMVGDGVNDAPALATADVGIAMGAGGTDVALETADIALMADRLGAVADAVVLARRTARNLRQNVAIAVATVAALLAGVLAGEVHMAGGMLVHQASVLAVILNATRLLRTRLPAPPVYRDDEDTTEETEWQSVGASR